MTRKLQTGLIILVVVLLSACKSKQMLVPHSTVDRKLKEQVERVQKAQPMFKYANVSKMSASIDVSGRRFSTQITCKMRTDSAIHVSIQPFLGFEMFKIEISKDSILAFDKVNKKLYAIDFDYFKSRFGVDIEFNQMQAMLSNHLLLLGSDNGSLANCKQLEPENGYAIIENTTADFIQKIFINAADRIEKTQINGTKADFNMLVNYSGYTAVGAIMFPGAINIDASVKNKPIKLDFKISKVVFDVPVTFNSMDRSKYSPGDLNQLMNK